MKTALAVAAALFSAAALSAQVFRPATVNGAVLGGLAGAVIGNNSGDLGHDAWKGAAIGAAAGGLIGSAVDDSRDGGGYRRATPWSSSLHVSYGYHRGHPHHHHRHVGHRRHHDVFHHHSYFGHYRPYYHHYTPRTHIGVTYHYPGYWQSRRTVYSSPNYAHSGMWLGGLTGAIIGHNSRSGNTWRGAAIGAGAGLLLGSLADHAARRDEVIYQEPSVPTVVEEPSTAPAQTASAAPAGTTQNATVINNYYGTSGSAMGSANSMFGR